MTLTTQDMSPAPTRSVSPLKVSNPLPFPAGRLSLSIIYEDPALGRDVEEPGMLDAIYMFSNSDERELAEEKCLQTIYAHIVLEDAGKEEKIGWIKAVAVLNHMEFQVTCKVHEEDLHQMAKAFFDEFGTLESCAEGDMSFLDHEGAHVLYIDDLYIKERYRGYGLGLLVIDRFIDSLPSYADGIVAICIEATPASNLPTYDTKYNPDRGEPRFLMECSFDPISMTPVRELKEVRPESQKDREENAARKASAMRLSAYYQALGFQKWFAPELATKDSDQFLLFFPGEARVNIATMLPHFFDGPLPILGKIDLMLVPSDPSREALTDPLGDGFLNHYDKNELAGIQGTEEYAELVKRAKGYRFRQGKRMPAPIVRLCYKAQNVYIGAHARGNFNKGYPVLRLLADICLTGYEDHDGRPVGSIKAFIAQTGVARQGGISFYETCKAACDEMGQVARAFYNDAGEFQVSPHDIEFGHQGQGDLLFIQDIQITQEYRGYGIGLLALDGLLKSLPGFREDTVVLAIPQGCKSLEKYFYRFGFDKWSSVDQDAINGKTFWGLRTEDNRPSLKRIVPRAFMKRNSAEEAELEKLSYGPEEESDGDWLGVD